MANISVRVDGIDDVVRELHRRGVDVADGLEVICHAGATVVREAAMRRAPGSIAEDLEQKTTRRRRTDVTVEVRPGKAHRKIAHLVEFGTRPHMIRPRRRRALLIGGRLVAWARHPGARARPFMRPAVDTSREKAQAAMSAATKKAARI
jgi:HK97 gp10 family phage protein